MGLRTHWKLQMTRQASWRLSNVWRGVCRRKSADNWPSGLSEAMGEGAERCLVTSILSVSQPKIRTLTSRHFLATGFGTGVQGARELLSKVGTIVGGGLPGLNKACVAYWS